jgi:hypothetical protein
MSSQSNSQEVSQRPDEQLINECDLSVIIYIEQLEERLSKFVDSIGDQPKFAVGQRVQCVERMGIIGTLTIKGIDHDEAGYLYTVTDFGGNIYEDNLTAVDQPTTTPQKSLGQIAYDAWPSHTTKWVDLRDDYRKQWEVAAKAVVDADNEATFEKQYVEFLRRINELERQCEQLKNRNNEQAATIRRYQNAVSTGGRFLDDEPKTEPQSRNAFGYGFVLEHPVGLAPSQRKIMQQCMALMTTLVRKNADYGDSAFKSPALMPSLSAVDAVAVRMSDKIARIANLSSTQRSSGPAVVDESLIDTYLDLAGYAILQTINLADAAKPTRVNGQHSAAAYTEELKAEGTIGGMDALCDAAAQLAKVIDTPCGPVEPQHWADDRS